MRRAIAVTADAVAGALLWLALIAGGYLTVMIAFLSPMAFDNCDRTSCPNIDHGATAMYLLLLGVPVIWLLAAVGTIVSIACRRRFWYWPVIGLCQLTVVLLAGTWLLDLAAQR